jgi:hypothetical protein
MFSVTNGPGDYQVAIMPVLFAGLEAQAWAIREREGETQAAPDVPASRRAAPTHPGAVGSHGGRAGSDVSDRAGERFLRMLGVTVQERLVPFSSRAPPRAANCCEAISGV